MSIFSSIIDKVKSFIDVHVNLLKVNLMGRAADVLSYLMYGMIVLFILFCVILFFGFGISEVFVELGLTKLAAYFATMGFYVLLLLIIFACRKQITKFFADGMIRVMTEGDDDNVEQE